MDAWNAPREVPERVTSSKLGVFMVRHIASSAFASIKSLLGILGTAVLVLGLLGVNLGIQHVIAAWACVAGVSLIAVAAVWEQAKLRTKVGDQSKAISDIGTQLTKSSDRAWHYEKERDRYRGMVEDAQRSWQSPPVSGPTGTTSGDVNQRAFLYEDVHQLKLPAEMGPEWQQLAESPPEDESDGTP